MGNQTGKHNNSNQGGKPKKYVHWKTAECPSPPGRPQLIPLSDQQPDVITLKWDRSKSDGGSAILGYIVEHRRMGSPHWVRATPSLVIKCEVSISGLEPGWRYQFRAIAENVVGKSDPSELSDPLTVTLQRNAITVPRFISELKDTKAIENQKVEMKVTILGQPQPEISWFKDGFEIFSSRRTKIVHENDVSVLIIHQVSLTDEGEIKCTATNRAGHVVSRAKLKVEAPPKIRLPRNYEDGLIVEADEILRLKVGIGGQPLPTVIWSHEGVMVKNGGRFELITNDKNSSLKIDNVKREDRGEYHLRAVNILGEDIASFLVTVTAKPKPPGKVKLNMSFGKSATLSWIAPIDDGGCKIGNYIVEYYRIGWDVWLKAATTRQLTATLHDLIEGSEYKFRVKAENPYGLSDPSAESDVLFIPDPKRGISKPENREPTSPSEKPLPPKRKTVSPLISLLDVSDKSPFASRESSPNRQGSTSKNIKPELYESEQLNREMSYGTPNEIVNGNNIKRTLSNSKIEQSIESRNSLSPVPTEDPNSAKTSPSLSRRGSFKLEVTQKIQQFFKRSPSPSRRNISPTKETSSTDLTKISPKDQSPIKDKKEEDFIKSDKTSPITKSLPIIKKSETQIGKTLTKETEQQIQERLYFEKENEKIKGRIPSPFPRRKESSVETDSRKSPGLQRSQEPVNFSETSPVRETVNNHLNAINQISPPKSPIQLKLNGNIPKIDNPTIEISAPVNDLQVPSDTDKRDEVHTSNEFMLVLYSDKKSKKNEKNESFDLDLEDALSPPPLSLSAPDLSDPDQYLFSIQLRRSVSSTELLYERAMARFYEAVQMEETEKSRKQLSNKDQLLGEPTIMRKRLGSMSEAERISFERRSNRRRSADISQEFILPNKWDSKENLSSLLSAQKSIEQKMKQIESDFSADEDQQIITKIHKNDSLEYDSDYTESTASDSEASMEKFKSELMARTRSTSGELETYHPRRMSEGTFSPYRSPTPDQASVVLTRPHPLPSPDFIPKPILKRSSNENVVKDDSGSDTNKRNVTDNFVKNQSYELKIENNKRNNLDEIKLQEIKLIKKNDETKDEKKDEKKTKGFKSFFKRDKNSDNSKDPKNHSISDGNDNNDNNQKVNSNAMWNRQNLAKQKSFEEAEKKILGKKIAAEEAKVVIDHYSDIVKELGRSKSATIPLYLNSEELKKAAEKADLEERKYKIETHDIDPEEAEQIARAIARPRMSIVERIQSQHVQIKSRSALEKTNKDLTQPELLQNSEEEKEVKQKPIEQSKLESQNQSKNAKVKKVIKKRVASASRSRDDLESKTLTNTPSNSTGELGTVKKIRQLGENPAIKRRQTSKTRITTDSQSPVTFNRRTVKIDPTCNPKKPTTEISEKINDLAVTVTIISQEEIADLAQENVRSAVSYITDVGLFIIACWVYIFKDARLVLPILALMVYRQIGEAINDQIPDWMKRKKS